MKAAAKKHVVMFSGGLGSYATAKRVIAAQGKENVWLLFADTGIEDPDLYRFLDDAGAALGRPITKIADGRTPWQVFEANRFIGNTRVDLCSKLLKRRPCDKWLQQHCDPAQTVVYVGIDWSESHRFERMAERKLPWVYEAPLCQPPLLTKAQMAQQVRDDGIAVPRLYAMGFQHNNCGGFCVKAGQAHFANLLRNLPDVYAENEAQEERLRQTLQKDVAILRDRRGGAAKPLTLQRFRQRLDAKQAFDQEEWGGCGCYAGT